MGTMKTKIRRIMCKEMAISVGTLALMFFVITMGFAQTPLRKDVVTLAAINFHAVWGDKARNLERIKGYIVAAAKQGADIIVFPEMALTGYDVDLKKEGKMQKENAETIPGPSTSEIAKLTQKYGVYVALGMPERDKKNPDIIYNSAAVIGPKGVIGSYHKIHPYKPELKWCRKGKKPFVFDTPWGLIGVGICYDSYRFPELARYYAALGARVYLNLTAIFEFRGWEDYYKHTLASRSIENSMFVVSANLVGKDLKSYFPGGSLIMGPALNSRIKTYAGPADKEEQIVMATVDLSYSDSARTSAPLFTKNPISGTPDWRPKIYIKMLEDFIKNTKEGK